MENKKITRRKFLRMLTIGLVAAATAAYYGTSFVSRSGKTSLERAAADIPDEFQRSHHDNCGNNASLWFFAL